jgi:hypothetical protein
MTPISSLSASRAQIYHLLGDSAREVGKPDKFVIVPERDAPRDYRQINRRALITAGVVTITTLHYYRQKPRQIDWQHEMSKLFCGMS